MAILTPPGNLANLSTRSDVTETELSKILAYKSEFEYGMQYSKMTMVELCRPCLFSRMSIVLYTPSEGMWMLRCRGSFPTRVFEQREFFSRMSFET